MTLTEERKPRRLRLRYPASCVGCEIALSKGAEAVWDPSARTVTCLTCAPSEEITAGEAGASAAAEDDRRSDRRVELARRRYGDQLRSSQERNRGKEGSTLELRNRAFAGVSSPGLSRFRASDHYEVASGSHALRGNGARWPSPLRQAAAKNGQALAPISLCCVRGGGFELWAEGG